MECTTMKIVMKSDIEAELREFFLNFKWGATLIITLEEIGHQQPPTPLSIDSATSNMFLNNNIRQQKCREIDIIFYWIWVRMIQGHYLVYWARGKYNLDDYFIKHHPTKYQRVTREKYLFPTSDSIKHAFFKVPSNLQRCVKSIPAQEMGDKQTMSTYHTNGKRTDRDG